ncbi:hypothetical protein NL446_03380 [Klebsiella pneumoniae]|uniref:hypothetical protein n=1 Tax=Klebsiella TaxID=570 RepID=UPI0013EEBDF3|nr:hypothetical protein [Klebsiella pneumoniae]MBS2858587.1 hypothetical protein [Klebsiella pneumoniae]MCP5706068.1 hypothetical protein [Klebsiella pneumoniae]MCP5934548.1 hypothetical protein [Klebsiella pneumoniae]MCP6226706.1 hypothetical protein [Klebsiella pneumoniae]MCP6352932.1 hypothetical protein [Klebsiella pneumoniae]
MLNNIKAIALPFNDNDYLLYVPLERCNLAPMNYLLKGGHRSGHFSLAITGVSDVT